MPDTANDICDVQHYNDNRGIYHPLIDYDGLISGMFLCGQNYRNPTRYYGAYPPSYLKRIKLIFPEAHHVLHLFSGTVIKGLWPKEETYDINRDLKPDICLPAEGVALHYKFTTKPDLILADPPYNQNHVKYGTAPVKKKAVVSACANVLKFHKGYLVWLDTSIPMWAKKDGWSLRGTIGLIQSTNHAARVITILKRN